MLSVSASCSESDCLYDPAQEASLIPDVWVLFHVVGAAWTDAAVSGSMSSAHDSLCARVCVCASLVCYDVCFRIGTQKLPPIQQNLLLASSLQEAATAFQPLVAAMVLSSSESCALCVSMRSFRTEQDLRLLLQQ